MQRLHNKHYEQHKFFLATPPDVTNIRLSMKTDNRNHKSHGILFAFEHAICLFLSLSGGEIRLNGELTHWPVAA